MPRRKTALSLSLALLCALFAARASAAMPRLHGYAETSSYQYALFGQYPYQAGEDAPDEPVLWRILGPGFPEAEDIVHAADAVIKGNDIGVRLDEEIPEEYADVFCLMTEYIIDVAKYNDVRDERDGPALDYEDTLMARYMEDVLTGRLFTAEEQRALVEMPGRGLVGLPTRRGELHRVDYGFVAADFTEAPRRRTTGTPYAFSLGLKRVQGASWYFTTDWRRAGFRWIAADNGHISVAGAEREGGIRAVCYVHTDMLDCLGGSGKIDDPYIFAVRGEQ